MKDSVRGLLIGLLVDVKLWLAISSTLGTEHRLEAAQMEWMSALIQWKSQVEGGLHRASASKVREDDARSAATGLSQS